MHYKEFIEYLTSYIFDIEDRQKPSPELLPETIPETKRNILTVIRELVARNDLDPDINRLMDLWNDYCYQIAHSTYRIRISRRFLQDPVFE